MFRKICIAVMTAVCILAFSSCEKAEKVTMNADQLYKEGKYQEALDVYLEADADDLTEYKLGKLYSSIGNCYFQLGDYKSCIEYQNLSIEANPEYFEAWVNMGIAYRKSDDANKAMQCYENALKYDPMNGSSVPLYTALGSLYIERNKPISAITYLEKSSELAPENADNYAFLSLAYKMAFEGEKSDQAFAKAQELGYPQIAAIQEQMDKIQ